MLDALRRLFGRKHAGPEPKDEPLRPLKIDPPARDRDYVPPMPEPLPWVSDMVMEAVGPGERADYPGYSCGTTRIRWVSREKDEHGQPVSVREPEPVTRVMPMGDFMAADRQYAAPRKLAVKWFDRDGLSWCGDVFGRRVLYDAESFPCFDSSDYLYEDRYYRWFFLFEDGRLTRVQYTDGQDTVAVTEDVLDLENRWFKTLRGIKCFRE